MIETQLISILNADATFNGLVSGRIRPFTDADTTAYPCLTYWRTHTDRPISNDGPCGQCLATIQLDAWSPDLATGWAVMDAARLALNRGAPALVNGVQVDLIRWEDEAEQINTPALPGANKSIQRHTATIVVSYTEPT